MSIGQAIVPAQYPRLPCGSEHPSARSFRERWSLREPGPPEPPRPRLLDRVRQALRARHLSRRTEEAYVAWIRRYIVFHGKRHPAEMGAPEVTGFLTTLAVQGKVVASTHDLHPRAEPGARRRPEPRARAPAGYRAWARRRGTAPRGT